MRPVNIISLLVFECGAKNTQIETAKISCNFRSGFSKVTGKILIQHPTCPKPLGKSPGQILPSPGVLFVIGWVSYLHSFALNPRGPVA